MQSTLTAQRNSVLTQDCCPRADRCLSFVSSCIIYFLPPCEAVCLPYRNQLYFSVHQQCKNGWSHKLNGHLILFTLLWWGRRNGLKTSEVREQLASSDQRCVLGTSSERSEVSLQSDRSGWSKNQGKNSHLKGINIWFLCNSSIIYQLNIITCGWEN